MLARYFHSDCLEAGVDEAGRGCFAGPVFAAVVILPLHFPHHLLNDSKKLSKNKRDYLVPIIKDQAIAWAIGMASPQEIDTLNILQASFLAMHRAIEQLSTIPEHLLIDGNRFKAFRNIPHTCIVKGDGKYTAIAAASILAKTSRDSYMENLHVEYPQYGWNQNKAYPTESHRRAIIEHGWSPHHRRSFGFKDG